MQDTEVITIAEEIRSCFSQTSNWGEYVGVSRCARKVAEALKKNRPAFDQIGFLAVAFGTQSSSAWMNSNETIAQAEVNAQHEREKEEFVDSHISM